MEQMVQMEHGPLLTAQQYEDLKRNIIFRLVPRSRIVALNSLRSARYSLVAPVYVTLEYDGDDVIASLSEIEAFAYAKTDSEALEMLCEEIVQVYEDLLDDRQNNGPLPEKWLQYLESVIRCR